MHGAASSSRRWAAVTPEEILQESGLPDDVVRDVLQSAESPALCGTPPQAFGLRHAPHALPTPPPAPHAFMGSPAATAAAVPGLFSPAAGVTSPLQASSPVPLRQQWGLAAPLQHIRDIGAVRRSLSPAAAQYMPQRSLSPVRRVSVSPSGGCAPPAYTLAVKMLDAGVHIDATEALIRSRSAAESWGSGSLANTAVPPSKPAVHVPALQLGVAQQAGREGNPVVTIPIPFPDHLPGPQRRGGGVSVQAAGARPAERVPAAGGSATYSASAHIISQASPKFWEYFADEWMRVLPNFPPRGGPAVGPAS